MNYALRFATWLTFLVLSIPVAGGQSTAKAQTSAAIQKEFQTLIDRYYATWNTGDPEKAAPLYAKDADLVFYDLAPLQ
jgi:hypothetical protein